MQIVTDPATNRIQGGSYDANGNDLSQGSYNVANHFIQAGAALYGYAPDGKRVWKAPDGNATHEEFYFWSPQGQRLGTYKSTSPGWAAFTTASTNVYFGGRLIQAQGATVLTDRLGSNVTGGRRYYPYGQERNATANNLEKFTGYFRDAETGLDYADQRYHQPGMGRFTSPDPYTASGGPSDPGSWNRYAYAGGDPVNGYDPYGLLTLIVGGFGNSENPDWAQPGTPFSNEVFKTFGEQPVLFPWSGGQVSWALGGYGSLETAGDNLANFLYKTYKFQPGEQLNIVAFSEGGNVVKMRLKTVSITRSIPW